MSEARCLSADIITTFPETITESILCLLPIEEAARTSILSRDWRYKWTKIPKLVFSNFTLPKRTIGEKQTGGIESEMKIREDRRRKFFYAILQVMLLHQGPIHEFALSMLADSVCFEIDQILLHLSRNHTVKNLKLELSCGYRLPSCLFSLHHLTELYLCGCVFALQPKFTEFGSLRSLTLINVKLSTKALLQLLSDCPSLKSLTLRLEESNLLHESCTMVELSNCLPVVEHLTTWVDSVGWLVVDPVAKEQPASLIHLKYFCLKEMRFSDEDNLTFLAVLIKCSPNLEKIRLLIDSDDSYDNSSDLLEEHSDVWLEHLNEMEIKYFRNMKKPGMEFVKFILARSPKLKKVSILGAIKTDQQRLEMLKVLLRAPRVSPVEIIVV